MREGLSRERGGGDGRAAFCLVPSCALQLTLAPCSSRMFRMSVQPRSKPHAGP